MVHRNSKITSWPDAILEYAREHKFFTRRMIATHFGYSTAASVYAKKKTPKSSNTFLGDAFINLIKNGDILEDTFKVPASPRDVFLYCLPENVYDLTAKNATIRMVSEEIRSRKNSRPRHVSRKKAIRSVTESRAGESIESALENLLLMIKNHAEKQVGAQIRTLQKELEAERSKNSIQRTDEEKTLIDRIFGKR